MGGPLTLEAVGLMVGPALHGSGLSYVFEEMVAEQIADGRLLQVLGQWCPFYPDLHLYYPSWRQVPAVLKAFIEFVRAVRQG